MGTKSVTSNHNPVEPLPVRPHGNHAAREIVYLAKPHPGPRYYFNVIAYAQLQLSYPPSSLIRALRSNPNHRQKQRRSLTFPF
jgi:hypothetical protein